MLASYWLVASHSSRKSTACPRVCFSHGTVVVGGETFPDALITSPTLLLDVEACHTFCCFPSWTIVRETGDVRSCAEQACGDITTRSFGAEPFPSNEGCNDRYLSALQAEVSEEGLQRAHLPQIMGDDNALERAALLSVHLAVSPVRK